MYFINKIVTFDVAYRVKVVLVFKYLHFIP